jgi:hypothetical protein
MVHEVFHQHTPGLHGHIPHAELAAVELGSTREAS